MSHPHGVDEQVEDCSETWKRKAGGASAGFESQPEPTCQATMVSVNGVDRDDMKPRKPWASRLDATELVEMARRKRREVIIEYPRKPCKDGWMGPVLPEAGIRRRPCCTTLGGGSTHANKGECHRLSMMERSTNGGRPLWLSHAIGCTSCSAPIPRLTSYEDVEVMVVARPLRGAEGMGAATVGKGHRSTTYTGVRGPEALKSKVDVENATVSVSVHRFSWHATETRTARDK